MINRFQGDPKIFLTQDGADLNFISGQPEMDSGFENQAFISLFTAPGWWGNVFAEKDSQRIGSVFEELATGTIKLDTLAQIEQEAEKILKNDAFGNVDASVLNPVSNKLDITITISPPGNDVQELRLTRNSQNWQNQAKEGS